MNDRFLRACRRETVDRTPVWFMRQAGRYMAEYRALREKHTMLEVCRTPELAVEVTLQPIRAFDFDAAILFSDLLVPLAPMGIPFDFHKGEGPVVEKPVRSAGDVAALRRFEPREELAIRPRGDPPPADGSCRCRSSASPARPSPSPPTRSRADTRTTSPGPRGSCTASRRPGTASPRSSPTSWPTTCARRSRRGRRRCSSSTPGSAPSTRPTTASSCFPHVRRLFDGLADLDVPKIHFGTGTGHLLAVQREAGGTVIGVDWRTPLDEGWARAGDGVAVQGNLDPTLLFAPRERLLARVDDVLRRAAGRPGHVFNLGHGILPGTPVEAVKAVVDHVHEWKGVRS